MVANLEVWPVRQDEEVTIKVGHWKELSQKHRLDLVHCYTS